MVFLSTLLVLGALQAPSPALDTYIQGRMNRANVPGLAVAIVKDGKVKWSKGYGWADIAAARAVEKDTAFMIASISKTVTTTALMQVFETGAFQLDDTIESTLGVTFEHPLFPATPPTYRQLLTHTASLKDNGDIYPVSYVNGDSPVPLSTFIQSYFLPDGRLYDSNKNFTTQEPGTNYRYCNIGFGAVGALVEANTGTGFSIWCDVNIFQPLGMQNTSWFLAGMNPGDLAVPYRHNFWSGGWNAIEHYGFPTYPDGQLRSSVDDMAKFLIAHIENGTYNGVRILDARTVQEIRRIQFPAIDDAQGLGFYSTFPPSGTRIGHTGSDKGVATLMWYRESDSAGVIVLANSTADLPWEWAALADVVNALFTASEHF